MHRRNLILAEALGKVQGYESFFDDRKRYLYLEQNGTDAQMGKVTRYRNVRGLLP